MTPWRFSRTGRNEHDPWPPPLLSVGVRVVAAAAAVGVQRDIAPGEEEEERLMVGLLSLRRRLSAGHRQASVPIQMRLHCSLSRGLLGLRFRSRVSIVVAVGHLLLPGVAPSGFVAAVGVQARREEILLQQVKLAVFRHRIKARAITAIPGLADSVQVRRRLTGRRQVPTKGRRLVSAEAAAAYLAIFPRRTRPRTTSAL